MRRTVLLLAIVLGGCTAQVSDLDDLEVNDDACDPRGTTALGTDLDLQFVGLTPHINQDIFFAVTVDPDERNIEAMMVLSSLEDPDLHLVVPKLLPAGPSELAFWADSMPFGMFNGINESGDPIDHQWTRPICPNGKMTFTHTTPFQSVKDATSTGAIFRFMIPEAVQNDDLFNAFRMWVTVTKLDDNDPDEEEQTRAFFRWSPHVPNGEDEQPLRTAPAFFQVGGNALDEPRGAIDQLSLYHIELVVDVDEDGEKSRGDFVCSFERQRAPDSPMWEFMPDLTLCDAPSGFDPIRFRRQLSR